MNQNINFKQPIGIIRI